VEAAPPVFEYYKLHADFYQTWEQDKLEKLEDLCAAGTCYIANMQSNLQVDCLPVEPPC
jgi:hypothetical protein